MSHFAALYVRSIRSSNRQVDEEGVGYAIRERDCGRGKHDLEEGKKRRPQYRISRDSVRLRSDEY